jgi:multidrug efflux system membrane fusion protein
MPRLCETVVRFAGLGLALSLFALSGCSPPKPNSAAGSISPAPVTVAVAMNRDVPVQVAAIGHVSAFSTVAVKSQVDGKLERVLFQEGDEVRAGQTLFTIDSRPFESALHQAEANLAKDSALATNAIIEERRNASLLNQQIISQDSFDQTRAAADALRATVVADKAAVENSRLQLAYCTISSPINARAGKLLVNAGNVLKNNDTVLVVLNQTRPIYVDFSVPEQELPRIREHATSAKLKVEARAPGDEALPSAGELAVINNTVDTDTGTILLRALFANADERLWPGQFVNAALTLTTRTNAVLVPSSSVQVGQDGRYVFVVTPELAAEARPVVVGDRVGDETIIQSGLRGGERLVVSGQLRLVSGVRVEIQNERSRSLATVP